MGKPYFTQENQRKTRRKWWLNGILWDRLSMEVYSWGKLSIQEMSITRFDSWRVNLWVEHGIPSGGCHQPHGVQWKPWPIEIQVSSDRNLHSVTGDFPAMAMMKPKGARRHLWMGLDGGEVAMKTWDDHGACFFHLTYNILFVDPRTDLNSWNMGLDIPSGDQPQRAGRYTIEFGDFPIETPISRGLPIATLDYQRAKMSGFKICRFATLMDHDGSL